MNIIERAQQWAEGVATITAWLGSGGAVVPREQAQARADICLKCPMNVKDFAFPEVVAAAVRKQVEIKNKLELRVGGEKSLHTCSACGCVLKLKIHVPLRNLGVDAAELEKFDASCWMRKEFKPL